MKQIKLTEQELKELVTEAVNRVLAEIDSPEKAQQMLDSWDEIDKQYERDPLSDEMDAELDRNLSTYDLSQDMAHSYVMNDPIHEKVKGTTLRDRIKSEMGNNIK